MVNTREDLLCKFEFGELYEVLDVDGEVFSVCQQRLSVKKHFNGGFILHTFRKMSKTYNHELNCLCWNIFWNKSVVFPYLQRTFWFPSQGPHWKMSSSFKSLISFCWMRVMKSLRIDKNISCGFLLWFDFFFDGTPAKDFTGTGGVFIRS